MKLALSVMLVAVSGSIAAAARATVNNTAQVFASPIVGCEAGSSAARPDSRGQSFSRLAAFVSAPLVPAGTAQKQPDNVMAVVAEKIRQCEEISREPGEIGIPAAQAATLFNECLRVVREESAASGEYAILALLSLGKLEAEPPPVSEWAADSLRDRSSQFAALIEKCRAQRDIVCVGLVQIAKARASEAAKTTPLSGAFHEKREFLDAFGADTLELRNTSGDVLHDCFVSVTLRNRDGESRTEYHFVREWSRDLPLRGRYESGIELGGVRTGRATVSNVETITVSIWARELSFPGMVIHNQR